MKPELLIPIILAAATFLIVLLYFAWIFLEEIKEFKDKPLLVQLWNTQSKLIPATPANTLAGGSSQSSVVLIGEPVSPRSVPDVAVAVSLSPQTQIEIEQQQQQRPAQGAVSHPQVSVRPGVPGNQHPPQSHLPQSSTRSLGAINPAFVSSTLELEGSST